MNFRIVLCLVLACLAHGASARRPEDAPVLSPPGAGFTIVNVSTAQQLADACWNLTSNRVIVIAAGTYNLGVVAFPNGVDGRLTVGRFGAPAISNIQIRGATGNPADVVLLGAGMLNTSVPYGLQIFTATDVTIADLSIGNVYYHGVAIQGDQGARRVRLYHLRIFDTGQQLVKGQPGADDVTVEYSDLFYTSGAPHHPDGAPPNSCYTNGIDGVNVARWTLRDNRLTGIRCADNTLAGPAILLWQGASASVVERNTIVDSSRGISLGLVSASDHSGGVARNNFIRWNPSAAYAVDVPIYVASSGTKVLHNSALASGRYANAIEVRFGGSGNEARNNLLDAAIALRDGAAPVLSNNRSDAQTAWFLGPASGDLHLAATAPVADALDRLVDAADDFDGELRPSAAAATDYGADERPDANLLFADGYE